MMQLVASGANRVYVTLDEIPDYVGKSFVAIEDERFYEHSGIDIKGIGRAFVVGVKNGFDLEMLDAVCRAVSVPVIASGGAGCVADFTKLFTTLPGVDAGLAASIFHFHEVAIPDLKAELIKNGIPMRA